MAVSYFKDIYETLSQKHPNKKIYVISDHHFFHENIIKYERPEFSNVSEMNQHIIDAHNSVIGPDDIVIFLGDFSFSGKKEVLKNIISQMNGHKYLLMGNHDYDFLVKQYGILGFEGIFTTPVKMNNTYLSHEPFNTTEEKDFHFKLLVKSFDSNPKAFNYHGHIHTTEKENSPYINVCCEALGYKPILIGYTGGMLKADDSPLIINSDKFQNILQLLKEEKSLDPELLLTDYLYSMMLEANSAYSGSCFVYGSYPLYKKFGFVSNFSDLDVALIYNDSISKNRNGQRLKETVDRMYESVRDIDGVNISFIKRIVNMCAFEAKFASKQGYFAKAILDANLVPQNLYRDTDFIQVCDQTTLQTVLQKDYPELLDGLHLPAYNAQYLKPNGDMANLILQLIFQKGYDNKKALALKKLKYVFKMFGNESLDNAYELEDVLIRFFLRNILFFHTMRRNSEIEYIASSPINIDKILPKLPICLSLQLEEIIKNPNSDFNLVFREITDTNFKDIPTVIPELAQIKK